MGHQENMDLFLVHGRGASGDSVIKNMTGERFIYRSREFRGKSSLETYFYFLISKEGK